MKRIRFNTMGSLAVPEDWKIRPNWPQEGNDPSGSSLVDADGQIVNLVVGLSVFNPKTGETTYVSLEEKNSVPAVIEDYKFRDFMEVVE